MSDDIVEELYYHAMRAEAPERVLHLLSEAAGTIHRLRQSNVDAPATPTENQIKHMVDRFLGWKLPANFSPDAGISYTRPNYAPSVDATPSGTNLFDVTQADTMVRHMTEGLPRS